MACGGSVPRLGVLTVVCLGVVACGGASDESASESGGDAATATTTLEASTTTVHTAATEPAQRVVSPDGQLVLDVPEGHPPVTAEPIDPASLGADPAEVPGMWLLEPSGERFDPPIGVTVSLPRDQGSDGDLLWLVVEGEFGWEVADDVTVRIEGDSVTVTSTIDHFSKAAVVRVRSVQAGDGHIGDIRVGSAFSFNLSAYSSSSVETFESNVVVTGPASVVGDWWRSTVGGVPLEYTIRCDGVGFVGTQISTETRGRDEPWSQAELVGLIFGSGVVDALVEWTYRTEAPGPSANCIPDATIMDELDAPMNSIVDEIDLLGSAQLLCETVSGAGGAPEPSECTPDTSVSGLTAVRGTCGSNDDVCLLFVVETETGRIPANEGVWEEAGLSFTIAPGIVTNCWNRFYLGDHQQGCASSDENGTEVPTPVAPAAAFEDSVATTGDEGLVVLDGSWFAFQTCDQSTLRVDFGSSEGDLDLYLFSDTCSDLSSSWSHQATQTEISLLFTDGDTANGLRISGIPDDLVAGSEVVLVEIVGAAD